MGCRIVTQADVDNLETFLNTIPEFTNVVQSGSDPDWYMDYDSECGPQRGKVVVVEKEVSGSGKEEIGLEMETP